MLHEIVRSLVLQTNSIQHARRCLCHTGIVVSLAWLLSRTLHKDTTQTSNIHQISIFNAISERAGSGHHRVLQRQFTNLYT